MKAMITELQTRMTKDICEQPQTQKIIKDRFILTENYDPDKILHREDEITELINLTKTIWGGGNRHLNINGSTGTGKTMLCRNIGNELNQLAEKNNRGIKAIYCNCKTHNTSSKLTKYIATELKGDNKVGLGTNSHLSHINNFLNTNEAVLIILDEIHELAEKPTEVGILYNFADNRKFNLIFITNKVNWYNNCVTDKSIRSRLGGMFNVVFSPYTNQQIYDILHYRAELALNPNTYPDKVLFDIANKIAQRTGDMRDALKLLEFSADIATNSHKNKIEIVDVKKGLIKWEDDSSLQRILTESPSNRLILISIHMYQKMFKEHPTIEQIQNKYNELVINIQLLEPLQYGSIRNYIKELESADLVEQISGRGLGHGRGKEKDRYMFTTNVESKHLEELWLNLRGG